MHSTNASMNISLSRWGNSFATRDRAKMIGSDIVDMVGSEAWDFLDISFAGVAVVSGSFADEFVGALRKRGLRVRLIALSDLAPLVETRMRWAVDHRKHAEHVRRSSNEKVLIS